MNLYLIRQDVVNGYDTYDSAVVCVESEHEARRMNPSGDDLKDDGEHIEPFYCEWAVDPKDVEVVFLGEAASHIQKGFIIASYNRG